VLDITTDSGIFPRVPEGALVDSEVKKAIDELVKELEKLK
jgi:hypothetical protein